MDYSPKTSFIPKQGSALPQRKQNRTVNILAFFAIVIFLATLLLSIGVFFYHQYSEKNLTKKKDELAEVKKTFKEEDIESIRRFERRLAAAETLLDGHISLARLFDVIQSRTQDKAQLSSFSYERNPSGSAQVALSGSAETFNTIALQEREFGKEKAFEKDSLIFSGIAVSATDDDVRTISFEVSANVATEEIAYIPNKATSTASSTANIPLSVASSTVEVSSTTPRMPSSTRP